MSHERKEGWRMGRPKIRNRMSSLAAIFVQAIIPRKVDKQAQAALYEQFGIDPKACVYCGQAATDQDHFRAIVSASRPSGYFHTAENIVPSCGPCNQSKGASDWKTWMESKTAKNSPTRKNTQGTPDRIARLAAFAGTVDKPSLTADEMRQAAGDELWDGYWAKLAEIGKLMDRAQEDAEKICDALGKKFETLA
jgi:5-methylcytosine-specific restriction endonuclease McrA